MGIFSKMFGLKAQSKSTAPPKAITVQQGSSANPRGHELIKVYDKFGREMQITRQDWLDKVLLGNLEKHWNQPDELYQLIIGAFNDGFFVEVEDAARRLYETDSNPERGAVAYAILFLQTKRPEKAEKVLEEHIARHGETGTVLTNLAKAQSALGRDDESLQTLWHGLELDPNQDNGMGWYEVIHREKKGKDAGLAALKRIAALPGSWRAQVWIARSSLETGQLDEALILYQESLLWAGTPPPTELLMQISGDLGNKGHLPQIIDIVMPKFDPKVHGIQVGNNLIKATFDLGQLEQAASILAQLQLQQRPDWREALGYWESELAKARSTIANMPDSAMNLQVSLLALDGPLWLKKDHPLRKFFSPKVDDAPHIVFTGCTAETPDMGGEIRQQKSNSAGRFSRALPLFLSEQLSLNTNAQGRCLILWSNYGTGGFVLSGVKSSDQDISSQARMGQENQPTPTPDFVVNTHLIARGENWVVQLRIIRTIDAHCLHTSEYSFAEFAFHRVANDLFHEVYRILSEEAGLSTETSPAGAPPEGRELDHYLLRLEQCLAVKCSSMSQDAKGYLSNPTEIIDGTLQFCLQNPASIPGRLLLRQIVEGVKKLDPELVSSFGEKIHSLAKEVPVDGKNSGVVESYLEEVLA